MGLRAAEKSFGKVIRKFKFLKGEEVNRVEALRVGVFKRGGFEFIM